MPAILHRDRPARPGSPPLAARAGSTARHHLQSCGLTPTSTEAQGASRAVSHTLALPGTRSARKPRADHTRFCSELSQELVAALEFQTMAAARVGCAGLGQRVYVGRAGSGDAGHRCERVCAGVHGCAQPPTAAAISGTPAPGPRGAETHTLLCFACMSFLFNVTVKTGYCLKMGVL